MAVVIKCKMCGGDLEITEGLSVAECEYCGSKQTIPSADNEKKMTLFNRASRLLRGCEFDKAAGVFESIIADFPEEAEAYWGLVLCKYGIEYVDDPGTGKKVPTCHRSSFDSVLDDTNFEQACEYNDAVARRVYRDEARQIEELRKRIIEVSGTEEAYDVFISYKETGADGERTLDSVLAQDIYKELTKEGYRVFFSRISLENKLGVEYEPYIFAALNSAKVMLVVGTDYDHFDAVWVKNEWSRFLKLIESGQKKVLIPAFKNMDAYDMPKEFNKLAALDMGKLGAMQDLLHGVEKIIPKEPAVIRESVVLQTGDSKLFALLDRGNMAIEDGDWEKADSFFEDVLNHDSKNAEAYLGKTLAQEKCRTPDALVRKRMALYKDANYETLYIPEAKDHIAQVVEQYAIKHYLSRDTISRLYDGDLSYLSKLPACKKQLESEKNWWANHKTLSKAEKFATGDVAKTINEAKNTLFSFMNERIDSAEKAESEARAAVEASYAEHIAKADELVKARSKEALSLRENDYLAFAAASKQENDPQKLLSVAEGLEKLIEYKDSADLAKLCREKAAEIEAENARIAAEEAERQRIIAEKQKKEQQRKNKRNVIIASTIAFLAICAYFVVTIFVVPPMKYGEAEELMAAGEYTQAATLYEEIKNYKDSTSRILYAQEKEAERLELEAKETAYQEALSAFNRTNYDTARDKFLKLADYKDSADMVIESEYKHAISLLRYGYNVDHSKIAQARMFLIHLGDYKDSELYLSQIHEKIIRVEKLEKGSSLAMPSFIAYNEYGCESSYNKKGEELFEFNESGQIVMDNEYSYEYNEQGQVIKATNKDSGICQHYTYDSYGNVVSLDYTVGNGESTNIRKYSNKYQNGLLNQQILTSKDGRFSWITNFTYNEEDKLILKEVITKTEYAEYSEMYKYNYDPSGMLTSLQYYDSQNDDNDYESTYIYGYVWAPKWQNVEEG